MARDVDGFYHYVLTATPTPTAAHQLPAAVDGPSLWGQLESGIYTWAPIAFL